MAVLPMLCSKQIGRPTSLPASITKRKGSQPSANDPAALQSVYMWAPVQQANSKHATCVGTLAMDVASRSFDGAKPSVVRVEKDNFVAKQSVWCYLVGGNCVVCKGVVVARSRGGRELSTKSMRIARLPENLRPSQPLCFAALGWQILDDGGRTTRAALLVTLLVTPDGDIVQIGGRSSEIAIDLSAIRFCKGKGVSMIDEVSMHNVDVAGSRLVSLQGFLSEKAWSRGAHRKPLATLPESCQPKEDFHFVVPGGVQEGFHLIKVTPGSHRGFGGEIHWCDSIWNRDRINLTGVMFEASPEAMSFSLYYQTTEEKSVTREALLQDFHRRLNRLFGSTRCGLTKVFGLREEEEINYAQFVAGCKILGYPGQMTKLWAVLDEDQSGMCSYEELLAESDQNELCDTLMEEAERARPPSDPNSLPAISTGSNSARA